MVFVFYHLTSIFFTGKFTTTPELINNGISMAVTIQWIEGIYQPVYYLLGTKTINMMHLNGNNQQ